MSDRADTMKTIRAQARSVCEQLSNVAEAPADGNLAAANARCLKQFAKGGLMDLGFLSEGGLKPGDIVKAVEIVDVLASSSATLASIFMVNVILGGAAIAWMGTAQQKKAILTKLRAGDYQLAFAMTEPDAGSDAASLKTGAEKRDGKFVINGEKIYTTGAYTADHILVVAKSGSEDARGRAMSVFLVSRDTDGLQVEPLEKLAGNIQPSCRVVLNNVAVEESDVLGGADGLGTAWDKLRLTGALERLVVAATCAGMAERIVSEATAFSRERIQFGRRICEFQSIQHMIVEMTTTKKLMRLLVRHATEAVESGRDATTEVCMAKYYCSEQLQQLVTKGMRVFGGRAYFSDSPMSRIYREAPLALYAGGTIEIQKNLIARALNLA